MRARAGRSVAERGLGPSHYRGVVASLDDAVALITALPGVTEGVRYGQRTWFVGTGKKGFAWERPFSKADLKRFGDEPVPQGPILALSVDDLAEKAAVLEAGHAGIFTISHFDNYPAILVELDAVDGPVLEDAIVDAWLTFAPEAAAEDFLAERSRR